MTGRATGTILDDKYEIVRRLGSGGMGEVYLVRHLHLQELRVVKILRQDLAADPVAQKRFVREARLATHIKHTNVAILYDFSRLPDGSFYMVWEHIEGEDVGDCLRRRGPFPVPLAIRLGIQALRGLEAIHTAGIIHRDISPDNLMIMENQRKQPWLKIIDLGLATNLGTELSFEITQAGMFMGKLKYCSPEQARTASGEVLDRRTDLYSIGLVFYEMITGLPPFESENQHGFVFRRLSEDPLPMVGRNPKIEVPVELDRVVRRALERDREKRFPDGVSFIQALERVAQGLAGVDTREVTMPTEIRRAAAERTPGAAPSGPEPRQRSASELSRAERIDLLAQIEKAGRKVQETSLELMKAEAALAAGRVEEARKRVAQIEALNPRTPGLARFKERLAEAPPAGASPAPAPAGAAASSAPAAPRTAPAAPSAPGGPAAGSALPHAPAPALPHGAAPGRSLPPRPDRIGKPVPARQAVPPAAPPAPARERTPETRGRIGPGAALSEPWAPSAPSAASSSSSAPLSAELRQRVADTEEVLRKYLNNKQLGLARLALETLLELTPDHPERGRYESLVELLATEVERDRRAEVAAGAARAAIARRDFKAARQELAVVSRNDVAGKRAAALAAELDQAEHGQKVGDEVGESRRRLEQMLEKRQWAEAERELGRLADQGAARVTLDSYRERLAEARSAEEQEKLVAPFEQRYRDSIHAHDWFGAREVALELERVVPTSPRAAAMFAEAGRLESIHQKQQAVEQAVRQIDIFIEQGEDSQAALAFRILLQMDPDNRHRKRLERQLKNREKAGR